MALTQEPNQDYTYQTPPPPPSANGNWPPPAPPPPAPPYSGWAPAPNPYPQPVQPTEGFAIASLVLGIVWVWWIGSILAVIFGYVALKNIDQIGKQGRGMALAGLVLGSVELAGLVFFLIVSVIGATAGAGA